MTSGQQTASFWDHLLALRLHVIYGAVFFVVATSLIFSYATNPLVTYLLKPLNGLPLIFLSPLDPFLFRMDISLYAGGLICLPVWLALLLHFVFPALSRRQKSVSFLFVAASVILGAASIAITYFYLLPITLSFLISLAAPGTSLLFTAKNYIFFIILLVAVAFIILELPVIICMLSYVGVVNPHYLARKRRFLHIGLIIFLAIVTPTTDVVTLLIVWIPAMILVEAGLVISKIVYPKNHHIIN